MIILKQVDVDILFTENATIGQRIALSEYEIHYQVTIMITSLT